MAAIPNKTPAAPVQDPPADPKPPLTDQKPTAVTKQADLPAAPKAPPFYPVIMDRQPGTATPGFTPGKMTEQEAERYAELVAEKEAIGLPREDAQVSAYRQVEHDRRLIATAA